MMSRTNPRKPVPLRSLLALALSGLALVAHATAQKKGSVPMAAAPAGSPMSESRAILDKACAKPSDPKDAKAAAAACEAAKRKFANNIVTAACANEYNSDRSDHTAFMYRDRDITPEHDTLFAIVETPEGNLKRKLEDHGQPLSASERAADDARIQALLRDTNLQKKLKHDAAHDDEQADELLKLLPTAFLWTVTSESGDLVTLDFKPDPAFQAGSMEARVFADMAGEVIVSLSENRIRSMKGQMVDDVKILGGLVGRLHKGGTFQVEHREVAPHHWQLTELHVHIAGHILFSFKTIGSQEDEVKTDFKISPAQNFQQAYELLTPSTTKVSRK